MSEIVRQESSRCQMSAFRMAIVALVLACSCGCARTQVDADDCNLTVIIDRDFATRHHDYAWWPAPHDSLFSGVDWSGPINLGGGDGRGVLLGLGVIIGLAIVAGVADATVHHLSGPQVALRFSGATSPLTLDLGFGTNRFVLPPAVIAGLRAGSVRVAVLGTGTRRFSAEVPTGEDAFAADVAYLEFTAGGNIIINGRRVEAGSHR